MVIDTQEVFFDTPAAPEKTKKGTGADAELIKRSDLTRSRAACHRVENEIWQRLTQVGCTDQTNAARLLSAMAATCETPPEWCTVAAWERMLRSIAEWVRTFGTMELFWELRRKRDE